MATRKRGATAPDTEGKVACRLCDHSAHVLVLHLRHEHGLTVQDYVAEHPGAPVFSDTGSLLLRERDAAHSGLDALRAPDRPYTTHTIEEIFGLKGEDFEARRYEGEAPYVPDTDDSAYIYDREALQTLCYALQRAQFNTIWIAGPSGVGKTDLVMHAHKRLNRECFRVCFDKSIIPEGLLGGCRFVNGETRFQYGPIVHAMVRGATLFLDELDLANPHTMPVLRPVLERKPSVVLLDNGGERVRAHPDFRVVVTANTFGAGDDSGHYSGTEILSVADRQRIGLFVAMDFLPEKDEIDLLVKGVEGLTSKQGAEFVKIANGVREMARDGTVEEPLSPRQLVNWAEVFMLTKSAMSAANLTILAPLSESSRMAIGNLIKQSSLDRGR